MLIRGSRFVCAVALLLRCAALFTVSSEASIDVGGGQGALYDKARLPQYERDRLGPIPAAVPKGFAPFFIMKYEVAQGEYAEFDDTLDSEATAFRAIQERRAYAQQRGTIRLEAERYVAGAPRRPASWISWDDSIAFADWARLRPTSELEFTRTCRRNGSPIPREFPRGTASPPDSPIAYRRFGASGSGPRSIAYGFRAVRTAPRQQTDLARELTRIAASSSGTLGARVLHVESGIGAGVNADDWFPMMSVYKLPIVIHGLRQAESGTLDLSRSIRLRSEDRRPGFSPLAREIEKTGPRTATVRELVSSVMRVSDNTASDALLRIVGGPAAVAVTLRSLGISGINVDRSELEFAANYYGLCCVERMRPFSLERFASQVDRISPSARRKAAAAFVVDRRDSARPDAMATLLARLVRGELLNEQHTAWLLAEMTEMHGRDTRLRAGLPPGTRVALRPGTSGETDGIRAAQNDNAVISLPDGRGHLVITAFLKNSRGPDVDRDATLAEVARVAYRWSTELGQR